jgi:hypothetical protein
MARRWSQRLACYCAEGGTAARMPVRHGKEANRSGCRPSPDRRAGEKPLHLAALLSPGGIAEQTLASYGALRRGAGDPVGAGAPKA